MNHRIGRRTETNFFRTTLASLLRHHHFLEARWQIIFGIVGLVHVLLVMILSRELLVVATAIEVTDAIARRSVRVTASTATSTSTATCTSVGRTPTVHIWVVSMAIVSRVAIVTVAILYKNTQVSLPSSDKLKITVWLFSYLHGWNDSRSGTNAYSSQW